MAAPEFGVAHAKPRAAMDPTKKNRNHPAAELQHQLPHLEGIL